MKRVNKKIRIGHFMENPLSQLPSYITYNNLDLISYDLYLP